MLVYHDGGRACARGVEKLDLAPVKVAVTAAVNCVDSVVAGARTVSKYQRAQGAFAYALGN